MTERDWLECSDPQRMLAVLRGKDSDRKLRLFAVACCRRIWRLLPDERSRQAVRVAERYADARATKKELDTAAAAACAVWHEDMERASSGGEEWDELADTPSLAAYNTALPVGWWGAAPAFVAPHKIVREAAEYREVADIEQCVLLREMFGNPFRPVTIDPCWLAWNGGSVVKLAQAMYEDQAFGRMGILADALEDAGCTNADMLVHCRQPENHVRGCCVVDLILGKE